MVVILIILPERGARWKSGGYADIHSGDATQPGPSPGAHPEWTIDGAQHMVNERSSR